MWYSLPYLLVYERLCANLSKGSFKRLLKLRNSKETSASAFTKTAIGRGRRLIVKWGIHSVEPFKRYIELSESKLCIFYFVFVSLLQPVRNELSESRRTRRPVTRWKTSDLAGERSSVWTVVKGKPVKRCQLCLRLRWWECAVECGLLVYATISILFPTNFPKHTIWSVVSKRFQWASIRRVDRERVSISSLTYHFLRHFVLISSRRDSPVEILSMRVLWLI